MSTAACDQGLVGVWQLEHYDALGEGISVADPPGETYTFRSDCTWSFSATGSAYVLTIDDALLEADGGGHATSCDTASEEAAVFDRSCITADETCVCTYSPSGLATSGTYSTSGDQLELTQAGEATRQRYTVQGTTLTLLTRFGNMVTTGQFVKQ